MFLAYSRKSSPPTGCDPEPGIIPRPHFFVFYHCPAKQCRQEETTGPRGEPHCSNSTLQVAQLLPVDLSTPLRSRKSSAWPGK
jgi:hypothetical protein